MIFWNLHLKILPLQTWYGCICREPTISLNSRFCLRPNLRLASDWFIWYFSTKGVWLPSIFSLISKIKFLKTNISFIFIERCVSVFWIKSNFWNSGSICPYHTRSSMNNKRCEYQNAGNVRKYLFYWNIFDCWDFWGILKGCTVWVQSECIVHF